MGNVYSSVGIWASDSLYLRNFHMQADTGSAYSQLSSAVLRDLGWNADLPAQTFTFADGATRAIEMGHVRIRFEGKDLMDQFVFGEDNCLPLLGVRTMEELGLGVDLVNHRLITIAAQS